MKRISREHVIYSFDPNATPVERAKPGDVLVFETQDALGGQIESETTTLDRIDWSKVNPATGPVFVEGAEPGDTLVVEILDIKIAEKAVILVAPGAGVLGDKDFKPKVKILSVRGGVVHFNDIKIPVRPMIGVIGVAPQEPTPTGTSGYHGGNMDVAELTAGTKIYLPVFARGGLLAIGDLHAIQADGEACVAAAEVAGEVKVKVNVIKHRRPKYPLLEKPDSYSIIAFGEDLDEAAYRAVEEAVRALSMEHGLEFELAYMLSSLVVELKVNQAVDPKRGVRAKIPKEYVSLDSLLTVEA